MPTTETIKVNLTRDFMTNGQTIPAGTHELPRDQAEDLIRRQAEYNKSREAIMERHEHMGSAGTIAMGSGAE